MGCCPRRHGVNRKWNKEGGTISRTVFSNWILLFIYLTPLNKYYLTNRSNVWV